MYIIITLLGYNCSGMETLTQDKTLWQHFMCFFSVYLKLRPIFPTMDLPFYKKNPAKLS